MSRAEMERLCARQLLSVLKDGIGIVNKTFYHNPNPSIFTKDHTEPVVSSMRAAIALYEIEFGDLE